MESEPLEPCPVCGSEVRYDYPSLKCKDRCYSMKGDFKPTLDAHNTLCRHAAIGALVEAMCRNGSLDGPLKVFPSRLVDGPVRVSLATFALGVRNSEAASLLEALRALAAELEVSGDL